MRTAEGCVQCRKSFIHSLTHSLSFIFYSQCYTTWVAHSTMWHKKYTIICICYRESCQLTLLDSRLCPRTDFLSSRESWGRNEPSWDPGSANTTMHKTFIQTHLCDCTSC